MNHSPSVPPSLSGISFSLRADVEHAIQRRVELATHVADDIDNRQQILVIDRLFARLLADLDQFRNRHQVAVARAHRELEQGSKLPFFSAGSTMRTGISNLASVLRAGVTSSPARPMLHRLDDILCATPSSAALLCEDVQHELARIGVDIVVNRNDVGGFLEGLAHVPCQPSICPS